MSHAPKDDSEPVLKINVSEWKASDKIVALTLIVTFLLVVAATWASGLGQQVWTILSTKGV